MSRLSVTYHIKFEYSPVVDNQQHSELFPTVVSPFSQVKDYFHIKTLKCMSLITFHQMLTLVHLIIYRQHLYGPKWDCSVFFTQLFSL